MKQAAGIVVLIAGILACTHTLPAFDSLETFGGYERGNLKRLPDYEVFTGKLAFGYDLTPLLKNSPLPSKSVCEFQIEPGMGTVSSPEMNGELDVQCFLKYQYPLCPWFSPYAKIGTGGIYSTARIPTQKTKLNFISSGCAGFCVPFTGTASFMIEWRFSHISNGGLKKPNHGYNRQGVLAGIRKVFD